MSRIRTLASATKRRLVSPPADELRREVEKLRTLNQRLERAVAKAEGRPVGKAAGKVGPKAGALPDDYDDEAKQILTAVRPYTMTSNEKLYALVTAVRYVVDAGIEGDLVECGVFKGDMSWVVATMLGDKIADRTFYLYDSFEGFSPALSSAADYPDDPGFLAMASEAYRYPSIYEAVIKKFSGMQQVKIIRGFVPDTFKIAMPKRIAFLHIDLNSPAAEIAVLEHLFDRVVSGGYIVFDDYGWKPFKKQRDAENQFMAARGHFILELPTGQGLVIKR
jgi:hypothetical protein